MQRKLAGLFLSLELDVPADTKRVIEDTCGRMSCLEKVVQATPFGSLDPIFLPRGANARLTEGTLVVPLGQRGAFSPEMVYETSRVAVIAVCDLKAVVVIPGVGLMAAPLSALQSWGHVARAKEQSARDGFLVDSLVCHQSNPEDAEDILTVLGANVTRLGFFACSRVEADTLQRVLALCPKLTKLAVVGGDLETLEPLVCAYKQHQSAIATLIYQPKASYMQEVADEEVGGIVEQCIAAFASSGHPMSSIVRELHFETIDLPPQTLMRLAQAVSKHKRIEFICVTTAAALDRFEPEEAKRLLRALVDQPLFQNDRSRLALYTFLQAARRKRVLRELPLPCLQIVAQFAAIPRLRCLSLC